jgi:hypothetical protein
MTNTLLTLLSAEHIKEYCAAGQGRDDTAASFMLGVPTPVRW